MELLEIKNLNKSFEKPILKDEYAITLAKSYFQGMNL